MEFQAVIEKYNYQDWLKEFLFQVYSELILIFGNENIPIIYEAFLNTEIVSAESIYDYLVANDLYEKDEVSQITKITLRNADGMYINNPDISFDGTNYKIEAIKRKLIIAVYPGQKKNNLLSTIIHELGHLIKGYYNELKIEGDLLIRRTGFMEQTYKLNYKDGKVTTTLISQKGVGLEEGLNTVLEVLIGQKLVDPNLTEKSYLVVTKIARTYFNSKFLRPIITNAQITDDKMGFIRAFDEYFMERAYLTLETITDKLYLLSLDQLNAFGNSEKLMAITDDINKVIIEEYNPFFKRLLEARKNKMSRGE